MLTVIVSLRREAMDDSSASTNKNDRRALTNVACLWAQAAMSSEKGSCGATQSQITDPFLT
jgi:hypothetical protein